MAYFLTDIVNEILIEIGEAQSNKFARFYQFGVACLREQNMDLSGVPVVAELTISSTDTVDLPVDYLNYTRIALCGRDGQLHSLGRNNNLCLDKTYTNCGDLTLSDTSTSEFLDSGVIGDNIRNGEVMGRFFGIGGGNNANGSYRFDLLNGRIVLGNVAAGFDSIVLEYLSDIELAGNDFVVHPFLIETVKDWIYWKSIARDRNRNDNEKQRAMIDFQKSERLARIRFNSKTGEEWLAAFRHGNQAAVKW